MFIKNFVMLDTKCFDSSFRLGSRKVYQKVKKKVGVVI
jgi:hypothetical protein